MTWFREIPVALLFCFFVGKAHALPGRLDLSFDPGAGVVGAQPQYRDVKAIALTPDGKILIAGWFTNVDGQVRHHVARLYQDGSVDNSFAPVVEGNCPTCVSVLAVAVQGDGKVVIAGEFTRIGLAFRQNIARLNPDGSLDESFAPDTPNGPVAALAIQSDGNMIIGGYFTSVNSTFRGRIARLNANGTLDHGYYTGSGAGSPVLDIVLMPDEKAVLGGYFTLVNGFSRRAIVRLNTNGTVDSAFTPAWPESAVYGLAAAPGDKIIAAGPSICRLTTNGSLDTTFHNTQRVDNLFLAAAVQPNGKIVLAGQFTSFEGVSRPGILRLNADGSLDTNFVSGTGAPNGIQCMALQPDGRVLIGGSFSSFDGTNRSCIARIMGGEPPPVAPTIVSHPTNQTVDAGQTARFDVSATGLPGPEYQWLLNGAAISKATNATFTLFDARSTNAGNYSVIVSNEAGVVVSDAAVLTVLTHAPVITSQPTNQTVDAGRSASFSVTATGTTPFSYQWLFDGEPLNGRTQRTLSFIADPEEAGLYSVIVSNEAGTVTSDAATLTVVVYPPTIASDPTNVTAAVGQLVRFFGSAAAAPPASHQWLFNDVPIPGATGPVLTLSNPRQEAAGRYSMIASNSEGSVTSAVAVLTLVAPRTGAGSVDVDFFPATSAGNMITLAALQHDGRILIAGPSISFSNSTQKPLARVNPDGSADFSFSVATVPGSDSQFLGALPDGKIIWNRSPSYLNRLLADGSLDPSFSLPSVYVSRGDVLLVQPDGSIVVNSTSQSGYSILRLTPEGFFDFTFNGINFVTPGGTQGSPDGYRFAADALVDGKIIIGGQNLRRLHEHGAADVGFQALVWPITHVMTKSDGRIFVSGAFTNIGSATRRGLALLNADGSLDSSFNPAPGLGTVSSMALQPDGKLMVVASNRVARLNVDGSLDSSFNPGGGANGTISSILLQPDCSILVVGSFSEFDGYRRRGIVRLNNDQPGPPRITREPISQSVVEGATVTFSVDHTCGRATYQWLENGVAMPEAKDAVLPLKAFGDGEYRVVVSNAHGSITSAVATLTVSAAPTEPGMVDVGFGGYSGTDSTVRAMAYQSNGKLIIAGWFRHVDGQPRVGVARLNAEGSVDYTFNPGMGPNDRIYALAVDANDRIIVGGAFTNFNGQTWNRLVRLMPDGEIDPSFAIGAGVEGFGTVSVRGLAVQPDGKIVVVGSFGAINRNSRPYGVTRLNPDGTVDGFFPSIASIGGGMDCVALQPDGKVLVGTQNTIYRIGRDGNVEFFFPAPGPAPLFSGRARTIVVQPDGKILVGFGPTTSSSGGIQSVSTTVLPVLRLNPNGTLDTNFNNSIGFPPAGYNINALHLHTCGRILIAGTFIADFSLPYRPLPHVARLTANGRFDPDFSPKALDGNVYAIASDAEKRIVIAGEFSKVDHATGNGIARLHAEPYGPPVLVEQPASQATNAGHELVLSVGMTDCSDFQYQWQRNGTNVPGGTNATLVLANARTKDSGEYRLIIRNAPHVTISEPAQVEVTREPRHPGSGDVDFFPPGELDGWVHALALEANGNLLVGGSFTEIGGRSARRVARFNRDGEVDRGFNAHSNLFGTVYGLATQPDGKVLAAGFFQFEHGFTNLLVRLMPDGRLDTTFPRPLGSGAAYAVAALPDGKILLAGPMHARTVQSPTRTGIARFYSDGQLDTNFAASGVLYALAFARQGDGRIIVGGTFTSIGQTPRMRVARLTPNGPADSTFDPGAGPNSPVTAVALSRDEKVYIGGNFTEVAGVDRPGIARLNHGGSLDESFDPGLGMNGVWALAVQADGKVLAGGSFRYAGGVSRPGVVRFNVDGSIDPSFDPGSGANGQVFAMAFDPTGKIYIGGNFTEYNGYQRDRVARINGDMFLVNPAVVGGSFRVSLFTFFGETYVLESANSLTNQDWVSRSSLLGDGTIRPFSDPLPGGPMGWYRVRKE